MGNTGLEDVFRVNRSCTPVSWRLARQAAALTSFFAVAACSGNFAAPSPQPTRRRGLDYPNSRGFKTIDTFPWAGFTAGSATTCHDSWTRYLSLSSADLAVAENFQRIKDAES